MPFLPCARGWAGLTGGVNVQPFQGCGMDVVTGITFVKTLRVSSAYSFATQPGKNPVAIRITSLFFTPTVALPRLATSR